MSASNRLRSEGDVRFVQFPHPGKEHNVGRGVRSWPSGEKAHRRTFLQSPGLYRTAIAGTDVAGELAFWGEWEGQARLVAELDPVPEGPRYLCGADPAGEPPMSAVGTPPQNTDPFVRATRWRTSVVASLRTGPSASSDRAR